MIPACFVISLERSHDRREHIAGEFAREGVPFEFVDAIDGRDLRPQKRISPSLGHPLIPGDIACTMSHGLAMKRMLERGHDRAIIFEDDARLEPGFIDSVRLLLTANVEWDFLKLCGPPVRFAKSITHGEHTFVWPDPSSISCVGYIITAEGARKLIPLTDPPHDVFDHIIQQTWKTKLALVEVLPRLVSWMGAARGMPSTIGRGDTYNHTTRLVELRRRVHRWRRSIWKRFSI